MFCIANKVKNHNKNIQNRRYEWPQFYRMLLVLHFYHSYHKLSPHIFLFLCI